MKKYLLLFSFALFSLIEVSSHAQGVDWHLPVIQQQPTLTPLSITADIFPIAAFRFYGMGKQEADLWEAARVNVFYNDPFIYYKNYSNNSLSTCNSWGNCSTPLAPQMSGGMKSFPWFLNLSGRGNYVYDQNSGPHSGSSEELLTHDILPSRFGCEASEMRFFVSSNFDKISDLTTQSQRDVTFAYDLMSNWTSIDTKMGLNGPLASFEWKASVSGTNNSYVLFDGLQTTGNDGNVDFRGQIDPNNRKLNGGNTNIYCDFIYRIPWQGTSWSHGDDKLFGITYQLDCQDWVGDNATGHPKVDANGNPFHTTITFIPDPTHPTELEVPIVYNDYSYSNQISHEIIIPTSGANDMSHDAADIKYFPYQNSKFQPPLKLTSHNYVRKRTKIPVMNTVFDGSITDATLDPSVYGHPYHIFGIKNCKVTSYDLVAIFVRGLRIRSELAEEILSGAQNNNLKEIFNNGKTVLQNTTSGGVSAFDNTILFGSTSEPIMNGIRVHAYVDNLMFQTIKKHIIPFISNNTWDKIRPQWMRSIYEEQTGKVPPPISMEGFDRFGGPTLSIWSNDNEQSGLLPMPSDGINYELRSNTEFKNTAFDWFSITGTSGVLKGHRYDGVGPLATTSQQAFDYQLYTIRMQSRFDGIETYAHSASAVHPPWAEGINSEQGKYYAHLSVENEIFGTPKDPDNNAVYFTPDCNNSNPTHKTLAAEVLTLMRRTVPILNPQDRNIYMNYTDYSNLPFFLTQKEQQDNFKYRAAYFSTRIPLREESRAELWNALCYGSQGLVFNPVGSDLGGNIGWSQNTFEDKCGNNLNWKSMDYTLDGSFTNFWGSFQIGSSSHPAIPLAANHTDQNDNTKSVFNAHIVKIGVRSTNHTDHSKDGVVYQTIPLYDNNDQSIPESNISSFIPAGFSLNSNGLEAWDNPLGWYNTTDVNYQYTRGAKSTWMYVGKEGSVDPATRDEFCGTTLKQGDGGNYLLNCQIVNNVNIGDLVCDGSDYSRDKHPFYRGHTDASGNFITHFHYPMNSINPRVSIQTFFGFKERDIEAERDIDDVLPIAKTLSNLHWVAGVNYSKLFSANTTDQIWSDFGKFPLVQSTAGSSSSWNSAITSQKFRRYDLIRNSTLTQTDISNDPHYPADISDASMTSVADANADKFYELGLFVDPNTNPNYNPNDQNNKLVSEFYVAISNKRTWPLRYKWNLDGTHIVDIWHVDSTFGAGNNPPDEAKLMGAVDARRFSFKIDPLKFLNGSNFALFSITNMRTQKESIISASTPYSIDFDPGEGTLFRISPAFSYPAGRTSDMGLAYNNGHRVAEIPEDNQSLPMKRMMVWERKGKIQWSLVNVPGNGGDENFIQSETGANDNILNSASGLDPNMGMNPSIAATSGRVAIIWNSQTNNGRNVFIAEGKPTTAGDWTSTIIWNTHSLTNIVTPIGAQADQLVTPSITPTSDGWFCSWSEAGGIRVRVAHFASTYYETTLAPDNPIGAEATRVYSIFPSVASRKEISLNYERLHLAWEEKIDASKSQIYYQSFHYDNSGSQPTLTFDNGIERVSKFALSCVHHHPNIAIAENFCNFNGEWEPVVTWEMINDEYYCGIKTGSPTSVMVRERYNGGGWSSFTRIFPKEGNLPLPLVHSPNYDGSSTVCHPFDPDPNLILDFSRPKFGIVFQDILLQQVRIERLFNKSHFQNVWTFKDIWDHKRLIESGLYPNLAMPYTQLNTGLEQVKTFTFRGIDRTYSDNVNEDNLYSARITARTFNAVESTPNPLTTVQTFAAGDRLDCETNLSYSVGQPHVKCDTCSDTTNIHWNIYDITKLDSAYFKYNDSMLFHWPSTNNVRTDYFLTSPNDTIYFNRVTKYYDSSWMKFLFTDTTKYIDFEVQMRDSASNQLLQTLDKIRITQSNIEYALQALRPPCPQDIPPPPPPTGSESMANGSEQLVKSKVTNTPPSGKAYLMLSVSKNQSLPIVLAQTQEIREDLVIHPRSFDSASYKKAGPTASGSPTVSNINLTIHPNPFRTQTNLELDAPKNVPLNISVFDVLGRTVNTLFNDMSSNNHYSYTLDSKLLSPGMYFVRVQAGGEVVTRKIQLVK